jgi:hypothetical protein
MTEAIPNDEEIRDPFLDTVLEDMASRSDDWCVVIAPLGDGLGFRASMLLGSGEIEAGRASNLFGSKACIAAIGRGLTEIERVVEESEHEDLT